MSVNLSVGKAYSWLITFFISQKRRFLVFQYPIVAVGLAIATDITQAIGKYCRQSNKPYFAHLWVSGPFFLWVCDVDMSPAPNHRDDICCLSRDVCILVLWTSESSITATQGNAEIDLLQTHRIYQLHSDCMFPRCPRP